MVTTENTPTPDDDRDDVPEPEIGKDGSELSAEDPGFFVLKLFGPWDTRDKKGPSELRIRRDMYMGDLCQRDFYEDYQEQAWSTGLVSTLSGVSEGVLRCCGHQDALNIRAIAENIQRWSIVRTEVSDFFHPTEVPLAYGFREPKTDEERKHKDPTTVTWRALTNNDLILSEQVEGEQNQLAFRISAVTGLPLSQVKRIHVADIIAIQDVESQYRKKEVAASIKITETLRPKSPSVQESHTPKSSP